MKPITRHTIAAWNPLIQEIGIPNNAMQILLILRWDIVSYDDDLLCCCYLFGIEQQYDCKKTMCCQVSGVGRNNKVVGYLWKPWVYTTTVFSRYHHRHHYAGSWSAVALCEAEKREAGGYAITSLFIDTKADQI